MTTVREYCPECGIETASIDRAIAIDSAYGEFPVRLRRYACSCGWVWANEAQRKHNEGAYRKARKAAIDKQWLE